VAGTLLSYSYQPDRGAFTMRATARGRIPAEARERETMVYLPPAANGEVRVAGKGRLDGLERAPGGGRIAYVAPTGAGDYTVSAGA
jgi:hypothetical protein